MPYYTVLYRTQVRAHSRACYWALQRHAPARAAKLLSATDSSTQRLLLEEQVSYSVV